MGLGASLRVFSQRCLSDGGHTSRGLNVSSVRYETGGRTLEVDFERSSVGGLIVNSKYLNAVFF